MIEPEKIFGRLGNRMFQGAALYALAKDNNVDLFFQDPKWFEKYEEDIKKMYGEGIGFIPYVGIHVRRGDYIGNPFYTQLWETDYYDRAIEMFPTDKFLVFSDDVEYCKNRWPDRNKFQIVEGGTPLEDLNMMASCKGQIIANSSLSWWAAYLCPTHGHKVIAPIKWFDDGIDRVGIPKSWLII